MLSDMDEINTIEKAKAIESIIHTIKHLGLSIEDLIKYQQHLGDYDPTIGEQHIDSYTQGSH